MTFPALPKHEEHALVLMPEDDVPALCDCGETFPGAPADAAAAWETHVKIVGLMIEARTHALAEHAARAAGEDAIMRLIDLGATSGDISDGIGTWNDGRVMVSRTLVQRLGRGEFATTPRRRRA